MLYKVVCISNHENIQRKGKLQGLMLIQSRASKAGDTLGHVSLCDDREHLPLPPHTAAACKVVASIVQLLCEIPVNRNISRFIHDQVSDGQWQRLVWFLCHFQGSQQCGGSKGLETTGTEKSQGCLKFYQSDNTKHFDTGEFQLVPPGCSQELWGHFPHTEQ